MDIEITTQQEGRGKGGRFAKGNKIGRRFDSRSAAEAGRKGQAPSVESRRKHKTFAELCNMIGSMKSDSPLVSSLPEDAQTRDAAVAASMFQAAEVGDTKAATWIRDSKGESKVDLNISQEAPFMLITI